MPLEPPDIGHAYFYDFINPPLDVGEYELRVNHKVEGVDDIPEQIASARTQKFEIVGPRFRLNPADVHSLYPPPNSQGPFFGRLPQVVLMRRTLPWERAIGSGVPAPHQQAPWLAVLLLKENEVKLLDESTVGDIIDHNKEINAYQAPQVSQAERNLQCLGIEVELPVFRRIAPMLSELRWLTHGRQVNTADKELLGGDEDGWFSVVVGNRLPQPGTTYTACLVSLEGLWDILPDDVAATDQYEVEPETTIDSIFDDITADPAAFNVNLYLKPNFTLLVPVQTVQLVTLARWTFETDDTPGTFQSLMEDLPQKGGVAMLGANQSSATLPDTANQPDYQVALDSGHAPLKHLTRGGQRTLAWYRGPLVPVGITHDKNAGPYHTSDQARRIDPLTGFENLGYAAAFELGRLLALSDPRFAVELLRWRRTAHRHVAGRVQINTAISIQNAIQVALNRLLVDPVELYYSGLLGELIGRIYIDFGIKNLIQPADITGFGGQNSRLPGLDLSAELIIPGEATINIGDLISRGASLEGTILPEQGDLALESDLNVLIENDQLEFGHLNRAFDKNIKKFGGA